jgi:preprotein translocase subunit YajC
MVNELKVNDQITTRGGLVGRIVAMDDVSITVESGPDRTRLTFIRGAVASVNASEDVTE